MNKKRVQSKFTFTISVIYIIVAIIFVLNFLTMSDNYQKEELNYMLGIEKQIRDILERDNQAIESELADLRNSQSMELTVSTNGVPIYTSLPFQNNMLGILNENSILMEAQGTFGRFDVWYALPHMPDIIFLQPFFIQQGILLGIIIFVLFVMIYNMRKTMRGPLQTIKESIAKIQDYDFSSISSGEDVINEEFNRFSEDLNINIQNVSRRYSELEIALQIERERLNNAMTVAKSFIHDMKSPIHQNLMANEMYIKELDYPDDATVELSEFNIHQNEMLLNTINDVLKIMKNEAFADTNQNESFDVIEMFMNSLRSFQTLFKNNRLKLDLEIEESLVANMNKSAFFLLIHNLLSNMGHYSPQDSVVHIQITRDEHNVVFLFENESSHQNIQRMIKTEKIFNSFENENVFSGGNGLFLIKDLSKILKGTYEVIPEQKSVKIRISIPLGDNDESL